MPTPPRQTPALPLVIMDGGLLLCPSCRSMDLSLGSVAGVLVCDECGAEAAKTSDQCSRCGSAAVTQIEEVGFSAPGQSPKEAPRKLVRTCQACGHTSQRS